MRLLGAALVATWLLAALTAQAQATSPSPSPCLRTLKFGGSLYLDTDVTAPPAEAGAQVGITDPNPAAAPHSLAAACSLGQGLPVYKHAGHLTTEEVLFRDSDGANEVFRSAGPTGFPQQDLYRWLVLVLVLGVLLFAAGPAVLAHLRQPPIIVGGRASDDDWRNDLEPEQAAEAPDLRSGDG